MKTTPVHTEVTEPSKIMEEEIAEVDPSLCGEGAQVVVRTWKKIAAIFIGGEQHETNVRRKLCFVRFANEV